MKREFDFGLTVRSDWEDGSPQWELIVYPPESQTQEDSRMISLFALVRSVYDSLKFKCVDGFFLYVPSEINDTPWHSNIGKTIEKYFQAELGKLMHGDWDEFSLIWDSLNRVDA